MRIAIEHGVNYFDTAYTYGGSEVCLGKFLAKGYRDKVNIATKLPHYYVKETGDLERYFTEQLSRLQTDHIEYYLMHMLNLNSYIESGRSPSHKHPEFSGNYLYFHEMRNRGCAGCGTSRR